MKTIKTIIILLCSFLSIGLFAQEQPKIQIALLLDTSNSMDGLINQAKSQLWKVVNEFALAKKDNVAPDLEIALYEYGNSSLSAESGWIRQVAPLTTDLDRISEALFSLTTNGGDEYCARVIRRAVQDLRWSADGNTLKVIFIAGNEPFNQGDFPFERACRSAISNSIIVNTIFCGDYQAGISGHWKKGADLADGRYMNIDQNQVVAEIKAPQDDEINKLSQQLNQTYIPFGSRGNLLSARQHKQDANASGLGSAVATERAISKSSAKYKNESWDLVDALEEDDKALDSIEAEELPAEMKEMAPEEQKDYVRKKRQERDAIQEKIRTLSEARRTYISEKKADQSSQQTLDNAILETVRQQAADKNYSFEDNK